MEPLGLELAVPNCVLGSPGGDWGLEAVMSPITRIPRGEQNGTPKCFDYCAASKGVVVDSWCDWIHTVSDHALRAYLLNPVVSVVRKPRRLRIPLGEDACMDDLRALDLQQNMSCSAVVERIGFAQSRQDSDLTCRER